jgi:hypothetical protein
MHPSALCKHNGNVASVHSNGGDDIHGHLLRLTIPPTKYIALVAGGTPFIPHGTPLVQPVHPPEATTVQITKIIRHHKQDQEVFKTYHDADKALHNQLIEAAPPNFIQSLCDATIGFAKM